MFNLQLVTHALEEGGLPNPTKSVTKKGTPPTIFFGTQECARCNFPVKYMHRPQRTRKPEVIPTKHHGDQFAESLRRERENGRITFFVKDFPAKCKLHYLHLAGKSLTKKVMTPISSSRAKLSTN